MKCQTLWTYDFTVITIGSFVSLVGNSMSNFALSLVVLDYTGSTFLYMLFNVSFQLPIMICPVLAGPYLDRMSRKKVIYTLDFLSAGIYFVLLLLMRGGWFNYPALFAVSLLTGAIDGIYVVAFDSFYPNLITEGNFQKGYSIYGMLVDLSGLVGPLASVIYYQMGGAASLFAINAVSFLAAACFEVTIRFQETHMADAPQETAQSAFGQFRRELREGVDYIRGEKGLLLIALYFMALSVAGSTDELALPYFLNHAGRFAVWPVAAATLYAVLANFMVAGRLAGGVVQYKTQVPKEKKFSVALAVYVVTSVLAGTVLFLPVPLMAVSFFLNGVLGVTSYTIRSAATQSYVPDNKRARFNGIFQMITFLGSVVGSLAVGALAEILPERGIVVGANILQLGAIYLFIWRGREHVKKVYNRDV
ncbi:MAG: MFS transporter [Oscillibacter sp.]|nr:MFS transporter [Oscillibacter sp.]